MTSVHELNAGEHPIKSITIFNSHKAEIVRIFNCSLEEGQNKVLICHLSGSIDTESARVTGLGNAQLFDVVCSVGRGFEEVDEDSPSETIRMLSEEKSLLLQEKDDLDALSRSRYFVGAGVTYELHATTEGGMPTSSVALRYRARVTQSTGEDWKDAALTLSTAQMNLSDQRIPDLIPNRIRPPMVAPPPNPIPRAIPPPAPSPLLPQAAGSMMQNGIRSRSVDPASPFTVPTSVVKESPLALSYHVDGASSVPSDGVPHKVSVAELPFEAKIVHVTVPKAKAVAYLQASVKNTSEYRLLPGPVNAFVDDSFVSKTSITEDITPGDTFDCTLGADPATRIQYSRTAKRVDPEASAFSKQWATTTYTSSATVTNRHPFTLHALIVRDGIPVSDDDKRVSVVLRRPVGLAEVKQGEETEVAANDKNDKRCIVRWGKVVDEKGGRKEGLYEWVIEVGAGESITVETEWDVKAPSSLNWIESA
ncbi:hypothetical protein BC834DRAFT_970557 [Gloeopeniophorella convolvens]|nr:hypothetical protein BC834DRAFT_970557 [Gloeopeniophorella convolvens]